MTLDEAIKKSIQAYFDGEDVMPEGRKYTKEYLDKFHDTVKSPEPVKSKKSKNAVTPAAY